MAMRLPSFLPSLAGETVTGAPRRLSIQREDFDLAVEQNWLRAASKEVGGIATFTGLMREMSGGRRLQAMTLEHYPGMVERQLAAIVDQCCSRWPVLASSVIHRYGRLEPSDQIVFVGIAASHRQDAFDSAMFVMDWLKTRAPFWKLEDNGAQQVWVEASTADDAAAARWQR